MSKKSTYIFVAPYFHKLNFKFHVKLITYPGRHVRRDLWNYFSTNFNTLCNPLVYLHNLKQMPTNHTLPYICNSSMNCCIVEVEQKTSKMLYSTFIRLNTHLSKKRKFCDKVLHIAFLCYCAKRFQTGLNLVLNNFRISSFEYVYQFHITK